MTSVLPTCSKCTVCIIGMGCGEDGGKVEIPLTGPCFFRAILVAKYYAMLWHLVPRSPGSWHGRYSSLMVSAVDSGSRGLGSSSGQAIMLCS